LSPCRRWIRNLQRHAAQADNAAAAIQSGCEQEPGEISLSADSTSPPAFLGCIDKPANDAPTKIAAWCRWADKRQQRSERADAEQFDDDQEDAEQHQSQAACG